MLFLLSFDLVQNVDLRSCGICFCLSHTHSHTHTHQKMQDLFYYFLYTYFFCFHMKGKQHSAESQPVTARCHVNLHFPQSLSIFICIQWLNAQTVSSFTLQDSSLTMTPCTNNQLAASGLRFLLLHTHTQTCILSPSTHTCVHTHTHIHTTHTHTHTHMAACIQYFPIPACWHSSCSL